MELVQKIPLVVTLFILQIIIFFAEIIIFVVENQKPILFVLAILLLLNWAAC